MMMSAIIESYGRRTKCGALVEVVKGNEIISVKSYPQVDQSYLFFDPLAYRLLSYHV